MRARRLAVTALHVAGRVLVFIVWLSSRLRTGALLRQLSRKERKEARAFICAKARIEYVVSRYCLRVLASRHLGINPREIEMRKTPTGQPRLVNSNGTREYALNMSLSHCAGGVAIAFADKARVGVDIETHRQPPATLAAAASLLTRAEKTLTEPRQIWDCWTRKEAFLKGLGIGFSGLAGMPSLEHQRNILRSGTAVWTVASIPASRGCSVAYAAEGQLRRLQVFNFRSCKTIHRSV
jgi:4'-phosphopantetheinyl transferase